MNRQATPEEIYKIAMSGTNVRRYLPLVSDRDRIYAARYQAERLSRRLNDIAYRRKLVWSHYADSNGAVVSTSA
jgi:hypothetical protein